MRRMVFFGSMMKTERIVKACHEAKLVLRTRVAVILKPYYALGIDVGRILVIKPRMLRSDSCFKSSGQHLTCRRDKRLCVLCPQ